MLNETACRAVTEHGPGPYRITMPDGKTVIRRLFCNPGSTLLCEFLPRKRRKGTVVPPAEISSWKDVAKVEAGPQKESFDIFRHNLQKIVRYTSASGLWPSKRESAERFLANPDQQLRSFFGLLTMSSDRRHEDWTGWYRDVCGEAARLGAGAFSIDELEALCREAGIKSIPYPDRERDSGYMRQAIRNVIEKKTPHSGMPVEQSFDGLSWRSPRYDHSARVRWDNGTGEPRGWYDEEYHGCGNGYYWIMLDGSHAMFIEKD